MDTMTILVLGKIGIALAAGILAGTSSVYVFNRIPAKWLCDYNQKPDHEMWDERIKTKPWNTVFSLVFIAASLKLLEQGVVFALPGAITLWLLLQVGMADKKYMIIPDQFVIALAVTAFGFIPFHASYQSMLFGALVGGGVIFLMGLLGRLLFRKEAMGFGDLKLFAAIGLISGLEGVVIILILSVFSSAFVFGIGLITKKLKAGDAQPFGPFIAASAAMYLIFHPEFSLLVDLYMGY